MKPFNFRAVLPIGRAIQNLRSECNRSSLRCHAKHQLHHGNARKKYDPDRTPRHRAPHRPQHRRNRDDVLSFSRQQRRRQRRRSRQKCRRNVLPQLRQHRKPRHDRQRKRPVSAQIIYDCALNWKRRSIRQPRHRKSLDGVLLFSKWQKILQKRLFENRCQIVRLYLIHRQPKRHRACAQRTCAHARTRRSRKAPLHQ